MKENAEQVIDWLNSTNLQRILLSYVESLPDAVVVTNLEGRIIFINNILEEYTGYSGHELIGKLPIILNAEKDAELIQKDILICLKRSEKWCGELLQRRKDGSTYLAEFIVFPIIQQDGSVIAFASIQRDITERKHLEEALGASESIYRKLTELSPNAIIIHDLAGKILFLNQIGAKFIGVNNSKDIIGENVVDYVHPDYKQIIRNKISNLYEKNEPVQPFEQKFLKLDGTSVDVEATGIPLVFQGQPAVLVIATDITERKKQQELLEKERERLFSLLDELPAFVYLQKKDYSIPFANRYFWELFGVPQKNQTCHEIIYGRKEPCVQCRTFEVFKTQTPHEWDWEDNKGRAFHIYNYPFYDLDESLLVLVLGFDITQIKRSKKAFSKAFNSSPALMSIISFPDGEFYDVNENWVKVTGFNRKEIIGHTVKELNLLTKVEGLDQIHAMFYEKKSVSNIKIRFFTKSGEERYGLFSGDIINLNGKPCCLSVINDITELTKYENEISRLERLNLIGQMAASIGHEIRNPMTSVRGFLQLFKEKKELEEYNSYLDLMIEELDRANSIITEFLSMTKNKPTDKKVQDLNRIIKTLYPLIQSDAVRFNMHVTLELNKVPELLLDENEIRQLVLNLCRNGMEAMTSGKKLTIRTFSNSDEVILAVNDQGSGISPEVLNSIGTPFLTTKNEGTGLGLAICYSIAHRHNADIDFETSTEGTSFIVRFSA